MLHQAQQLKHTIEYLMRDVVMFRRKKPAKVLNLGCKSCRASHFFRIDELAVLADMQVRYICPTDDKTVLASFHRKGIAILLNHGVQVVVPDDVSELEP